MKTVSLTLGELPQYVDVVNESLTDTGRKPNGEFDWQVKAWKVGDGRLMARTVIRCCWTKTFGPSLAYLRQIEMLNQRSARSPESSRFWRNFN